MKIAFVSDSIYPYHKGGKEKRLHDITTRLAKRGHDVHIYTMKWWKGDEETRVEQKVHLHAICPLYVLYKGERRNIKQGVLFGLSCLKLIKEDWDVIDVDHMPFFPIIFTKIVCVLKRKKMIGTWNEVWGKDYWLHYLGGKGYIANIIEKVSAKLPDAIISISELTTARLKQRLHRKDSITTVPCGIDYKDMLAVEPHEVKSDVMYAGRLLEHKNVDLLIKSIYLLKQQDKHVNCIIVGNGPERKFLEQLAQTLEVDELVKFYDFFPSHNDVISMMKSSKLFVFPSEREGFGMVAIEAYASGIPFITLDQPLNAAKFLLKDTEGGLFKKNGKSLAKAVVSKLKNKNTRKEYEEFAKEYDWENIVTRLEAVYKT